VIPADALRPARQRSIVLLLVLLVTAVLAGCSAGAGAATTSVHILGSAPETWDPALQGDQGTATTLAQVSETLTAIDAAGTLQPALAGSWTVAPDGLSVAFRLRPDLVFSDGTPLVAADVVRSWLRLLDPSHPAPLVSLLDDVVGVREYQAGTGSLNAVGIEAAAADVVRVTFRSGGAYFPSAAASPSLAVVPATIDAAYDSPSLPANFVGSGAYLPVREDDSSIRLEANPHYWAGAPAIPTIELITDTAGKPSYQAFEDGDVDYAPVDDYAASWIRSEALLGPQLVEVPNPAVLYYGFDTRHPPFADVRVRKAFAEAVDWRHLVELGSPFDTPATSLVPPGIAGRPSGDYGATYDPAAARADLAAAGFPGGQGFPTVTLDTGGLPFDAALAREWQQQLGVTVRVEALTDGYFERLTADPPQIWALDWVADYPAAQDFLGLLLTTGASNNYGGWSNADFDREVRAGAATADPAAQVGHFETAERIVQDQAPIVPLSYGRAWALVRAGLRGAGASTLSILRFAGLAWGQP
jgi:oligopeptide transport system substrate-binding protein